jgi:hypothetical protein
VYNFGKNGNILHFFQLGVIFVYYHIYHNIYILYWCIISMFMFLNDPATFYWIFYPLVQSTNIYYTILQGQIQDFKLGGGVHLKKLGRAEEGAKYFWVFRVKNLFPILWGACAGCTPPGSAPALHDIWYITIWSCSHSSCDLLLFFRWLKNILVELQILFLK